MIQLTNCKFCQSQILPAEMENLRSIANMEITIHSLDFYILEIKCKFCGNNNFIYQKGGLTNKKFSEIIEKI